MLRSLKTLYLDIFSGISGDMFVGALIDLGVDAKRLERELEKLGLDEYHIHTARGTKAAIEGVKFDVHVGHAHGPANHAHTGHGHHHHAGHHHHDRHEDVGPHGGLLVETSVGRVELSVFETNTPPRFRLYFQDRGGNGIKPANAAQVTLETIRADKRRQLFKFKRRGVYLEATDELPEPHEFKAVLAIGHGTKREKGEVQFVEDHHHHDHGHENDTGHDHSHGRNFSEIRQMISASNLSEWVKKKSIAVFERIAVAEGKIHGLPPAKVHFHEVGAVDSIVDIVGACIGLELLGKPRVLAGPVVEGTGWINCAHGRFPIPAPATLAILGARGVPVTQCDEPHELVTPTGAALLAELAESFGPMQGLVAQKIGFGLGTRDNRTRPNVLRAVLGESSGSGGAHDWETDKVTVLETNLDDINAEILGNFVEQVLSAGALDVFHTPIQMKKNRPGVLLTVLCNDSETDKFAELMLRETSAFGVRYYSAQRRKLKRENVTVKTPYGQVSAKLGRLDGRVVQAAPEFESCKKLATSAKVPLKQVYEAATRALKSEASRSTRKRH